MNISDWQHQQNRKRAEELRAQGFDFTVTGDGYTVRYQGDWVCGASVKLPREKPQHWRHRQADLRDHLNAAVLEAERHLLKVAPATPAPVSPAGRRPASSSPTP